MKIIRNNCAYIQKTDMTHLNHLDIPIPASLYLEVFGYGYAIINEENRYEFISIEDPDAISFIEKVDFILDYEKLTNLSELEIETLGMNICTERNKIAESYNALSDEEKKKHREMVERCNELYYKLWSLQDFVRFKEGELNIPLPDGVMYPEGYKKRSKAALLARKISRKIKTSIN